MKHAKFNRRLAAWTAAGVAGAGLVTGATGAGLATGVANASATPSASSSAASLSSAATGSNGHPRLKLARKVAASSVRGEIVLDGKKGERTVDFQRGSVSELSSSSFTVTDKTGTPQIWAITSETKVRERNPGRGAASSAELQNGENVTVIGTTSDGARTARLVLLAPHA